MLITADQIQTIHELSIVAGNRINIAIASYGSDEYGYLALRMIPERNGKLRPDARYIWTEGGHEHVELDWALRFFDEDDENLIAHRTDQNTI